MTEKEVFVLFNILRISLIEVVLIYFTHKVLPLTSIILAPPSMICGDFNPSFEQILITVSLSRPVQKPI